LDVPKFWGQEPSAEIIGVHQPIESLVLVPMKLKSVFAFTLT